MAHARHAVAIQIAWEIIYEPEGDDDCEVQAEAETTMKALPIGFDVPFDEAIEAAITRGVVPPAEYYGELQGVARQLAFSIQGITAIDQIRAVRASLAKAMDSGLSFHEWRRKVAVVDLGLPDHRIENIWRTNLQGNYRRGQWRRDVENKDDRPYLMYDAINDSRTRPSHLAHDGTLRAVDDPFWHTHSTPLGYRKILPGAHVIANTDLALEGHYSGVAVEIVGQSGVRLSVTAKHPVLTGRDR